MALEARLVQKMGLGLRMTPQLQQAIKLLQYGQLEFVEAIQEELLKNPLLEKVDEFEPQNTSARDQVLEKARQDSTEKHGEEQSSKNGESAPEQKPSDGSSDFEKYLEDLSDWRGAATPKGTFDHDELPSLEATASREETLCQHILEQLRMLDLDEVEQKIALSVIGNLNDDGYLCASDEEIAADAHVETADVKSVIDVIQSLEPAGVGARNLTECLLIQLENIGLDQGLEGKIVRDHLAALEKKKYETIAKAEGVEAEQVYKAVLAIQKLEPRPGRNFPGEEVRYVTPDIYVTKVGGEYVISLNEDGLPKLRVSPYYLNLLKQDSTPEQKAYVTEKLKAATWLIKSIHQRQQTIYKVTESIVKHQRDFFDHGIEKLRPLTLKDVADDIDMHESTVSRVTTMKYVHTPQGVFELKFFFTSGIKGATGDVSSSAVKERIKQLIAAEDVHHPISDQQLVELLKKENLDIARRTVAKYRESLNIASSSQRKKPFFS
jgi:RNA polymerase sigma-54 factor